MFVNITSPEQNPYTIKDLKTQYWIESRDFTLSIPNKSLLTPYTEFIAGNEYQNTVVVGYFVILKNLPLGRWRFDFGGYGSNDYVTHSIIDVEVQNQNLDFPRDKSGEPIKNISVFK